MKSPAVVLNRFAGDARLCVLLGGLVGIVGTAAISTATMINTTPVLVGATLAGFLYDRGIDGGHRVGKLVGLFGTLTFAPLVPALLGYSWPVVLVVFLLGAVVAAFVVVVGMLAGVLGGVARSKLGRAWRGRTPA